MLESPELIFSIKSRNPGLKISGASSILLPIATGIVSAFLYDLIKKYRRKDDETTAEVNMIVEDKKTKKSKKITYKGPVSGVKDALDSAAQNLFKED